MLGIICDGSKEIKYDGIKWKITNNGYYVNNEYGPLYRYIFKKYVGPIPKGYDIHHMDGDKLNNRVMNLWLMTRANHC